MGKVVIPKNATNGDMVKAMLNPYKICEYKYNVHIYMTERDFWKAEYQMNCDTSWWNAPYKCANMIELQKSEEMKTTKEEKEEAIKNIKEHCYFANLNPKAKEALDFAVKTLEQEPCEDAISRKAMLELQAKYAEDMGATKFGQMCDDIKALPPVIPQFKEKEFAKFNDFYPEDRGTYPPAGKEILIKNHNGDNFIAYLDYDNAEDGGWGFYTENGDFIADVNEIDAWMPIPKHERDKNYIPMQEFSKGLRRKVNVLTSNNTYKKFTDLSKDEIKQIVTDIFHPKKVTNIETHKEEITCTIYTEWESRDEETTLIADTLTLRNPFKYGEDAIDIGFSVNGSDYLKLKQFCFAKGIFHENWVKDNPYLQEEEKSIERQTNLKQKQDKKYER